MSRSQTCPGRCPLLLTPMVCMLFCGVTSPLLCSKVPLDSFTVEVVVEAVVMSRVSSLPVVTIVVVTRRLSTSSIPSSMTPLLSGVNEGDVTPFLSTQLEPVGMQLRLRTCRCIWRSQLQNLMLVKPDFRRVLFKRLCSCNAFSERG